MSSPEKLRGNKNPPELTRLKTLWRTLSESDKEFWRALFISATPQAEIRKQLFTRLNINLAWDKQLTGFRKWLKFEDALEVEAERMAEDERRFTQLFGETHTKEQLREKVFKASYIRALATGNYALGLKTMAKDREHGLQVFDPEVFKATLRARLETGLDSLSQAFKNKYDAMEFCGQVRALIEREVK
jgi:hypothetical protein